MAHFNVTVPPTWEQGNTVFRVSDSYGQTRAQAALQSYNSCRAHDGLPPIDRMPPGTRYKRIRVTREEYQIHVRYPGPHGWEHEVSEDTRKEAYERLKEYRENCPQYPVKLVTKRVRIED